MNDSVEPHLPELLRMARALTTYQVTLEREIIDGEEVHVFGVHRVPWEDFDTVCHPISDALAGYCWDHRLIADIAVLPKDVVDAPEPRTPRSRAPTPPV